MPGHQIRKRASLRTLHVIDTSDNGSFDLAPYMVQPVSDTPLPASPPLEIFGSCEGVYPLCRRSPPCRSIPPEWYVDVREYDWEDWYWLLEYDHLVDNRASSRTCRSGNVN